MVSFYLVNSVHILFLPEMPLLFMVLTLLEYMVFEFAEKAQISAEYQGSLTMCS